MVKVGFICEGFTEEIILKSKDFQRILRVLNIESVGIFNVEGNSNLLPHNILKYRNQLIKKSASVIIILTDLDEDKCITKTKLRITEQYNQIIIIAVKQIESWFLADSILLTKLLGEPFEFNFPENEEIPFKTLRQLLIKFKGRGVPEKLPMALKMLNNGFSIQNAANHPNCPSAKYFLTKLQSIEI